MKEVRRALDLSRTLIREGASRHVAPDISVFLGIFGSAWVDNAISSVEQQIGGAFHVIAAVNGPDPIATQKLSAWASESRHLVTVVQNNSNLGPLGSLHRSLDLISTPWVATLHQDDIYLPHHLEVHRSQLEEAGPDTVASFTQMEGVSEDGATRTVGVPQSSEGLDRVRSPDLLLGILRRHPLAAPTLAFHKDRAFVHDLVWFDSGAPDSEWYARLACRGNFRVSRQVTTLYRDTLVSESRQTDRKTRAWQWAQSLNRLLLSADFCDFAVTIAPGDRDQFARELLESIPSRYPDSPIFGFLQYTAAQTLTNAWDYSSQEALDFLYSTLESLGGSAAANTLAPQCSTTSIVRPADTAAVLGVLPEKGRLHRAGRTAYQRFGHRLSPAARKRLYSIYDRLTPHRGSE